MKNFILLQFKDSIAPIILAWDGIQFYKGSMGLIYTEREIDLMTCNKNTYCVKFNHVKELTLRNK